MTLNEALIKQTFLNKILLKKGECELSKELKVKIMNMRILLGKLKIQFDSDCKEIVNSLKPEGFDELSMKEIRSEKEELEFQSMIDKINEEYNAFIAQKGREEVNVLATFTIDEYNQIIDVNADNDIDIDGATLLATDFLEVIHTLFVE